MPSIELRNVRNFVLKNINLRVSNGELLCVLGPNGAGKTTLLKVIAGLVKYEGSVLFDDVPVDHIPPERRGVGYVPQNLALFPHMTVEENVAYGLRARGLPKDAIEERTNEVLELLELNHLRRRYPRTLSGGERQRVAIARALAIKPKILLLDEPFSSIQSSMKYQLISEIKKLHSKLRITMLFVTHDISEAEELGSKIAVLNNGSLIGIGRLRDVINVISKVLHELNVFRCVVGSLGHEGLVKVKCRGLLLMAPTEGPLKVGDEVLVVIPPNKVVLSKEPPYTKVNTFKALVIKSCTEHNEVLVSLNGLELKVYTPESLSLRSGDLVYVKLPIRYLRIVV